MRLVTLLRKVQCSKYGHWKTLTTIVTNETATQSSETCFSKPKGNTATRFQIFLIILSLIWPLQCHLYKKETRRCMKRENWLSHCTVISDYGPCSKDYCCRKGQLHIRRTATVFPPKIIGGKHPKATRKVWVTPHSFELQRWTFRIFSKWMNWDSCPRNQNWMISTDSNIETCSKN